MGEKTAIEWSDHTFNPWIGCTKVSPACDHCYAEALMDTRYGRVRWGAGEDRVRTSEDNWKKPLSWDRKAVRDGAEAEAQACADTWLNEHKMSEARAVTAEAQLARAKEGLEPFANAHDEALSRYPEAGSAYVAEEARSHLAWSDFRLARSTLQALEQG